MTKASADDPSQLRLLSAMLQHEVRTPLSALVGFAELLDPGMSPSELMETVQRIKSSARALNEVINAIPVLSTREPEHPRLEERPFEHVALVEDLVRSFRVEAATKQVELTANVARRIPERLVGAPGPLRQVLANLLSNALKFTDRGRVHLEIEEIAGTDDGVRLRYSVSDTGRGVPRDLQAAIFEPFVRGEANAAAATNGSGLGLSICVKLLRAMGSRIELDSRCGKGSTFSFELRHLHDKPSRSESFGGRAWSHADETPRVLIVDDDEDSRELLRRLVRREGFVVDLARDGREALSMLERSDYALLLSDLRMSGMDGFELARRIREREAGSGKPALPLVAVTAGGLLMSPQGRALQDCFDSILLKPLRRRVLSRLLAPYRTAGSQPAGSEKHVPQDDVDTSVISLIPDFLARRSADLDVLRACQSGRASLETVARIGHNLRGSALSYGFPRLSELGALLEEAARIRDLGRIARLADKMEQLVAEARMAAAPTSELERFPSRGAAVVPIRRT